MQKFYYIDYGNLSKPTWFSAKKSFQVLALTMVTAEDTIRKQVGESFVIKINNNVSHEYSLGKMNKIHSIEDTLLFSIQE